MGASAVAGSVLGGLSWNAVVAGAASEDIPMPAPRVPLVVKPILVYDLPVSNNQIGWSWRGWGGVQTPEVAREEVARITAELNGIKKTADFPVEFLELAAVHNIDSLRDHPDMAKADLLLVYGAGWGIDSLKDIEKDVIIFQRWNSGPVYVQYEIVSPYFMRQRTDSLRIPHILPEDIVTDCLDELAWRLRALCGLKNAKNSKIITIGGAGAWFQPGSVVPDRAKDIWGYEYLDISYEELEKLTKAAMADSATMAQAKARAEAYLKLPGTKIEPDTPFSTQPTMEFIVNCFMLDKVFRQIMKEAGCRNLTIHGCMTTIMPVAKTAACLSLTTLNDDDYLVFCESDFVVVPAGILLGNITGKPVFLCNPCFPHKQMMTFAHCTAPRKMDGKNLEPTRIVTHFESDYGAAPKIDYPSGMKLTAISTDFASKKWVGLDCEVIGAPHKPICTTQIDVTYKVPSKVFANRLHGFHWMLGHGDYLKEVGYALRRVGIEWENFDDIR